MAKLSARDREKLPDRAFAYIDSQGRRRLPINDEAHVRNALARFDRVAFEADAARDRARQRLLGAAKKYGIVPVGFITGQLQSERSARPPDFSAFPTGTVTFLLTDIEGSTQLVRRLGDDYAGLLRDVRAINRNAVRRAGGHKVDTHGDEFFAAFKDASGALQAAIEIQLALAERSWPRRQKVHLRAALHTGRPTLTDSGYIGLSVHCVARICSMIHGGQIVVSGKTKTALARKIPADIRLRSLGRHRLAGMPKPESLLQVEAKGLRTKFPPLRASNG